MSRPNPEFQDKVVDDIILESKTARYRWHEHWAAIPDTPTGQTNGKTHGIAVSNTGFVFVFHQAIPSILVYDHDGLLVKTWGRYPGAHGLTLIQEGGEEFIWLTDESTGTVEKLTLDGRLMKRLTQPDHPLYQKSRFRPTWVGVNETRFGGNGDIWVADGYGAHLVHRFDAAGLYLQSNDGSEGAGRFDCPHGIWFDNRKRPMELYVADRSNKRVAVYDTEGCFKRSFGADFLSSPDSFVNSGDLVIVPELMGRVTVLDADDKLVDYLGANPEICVTPGWPDLTSIEPGKFSSPHAAAVDASGNIFVVEWRAGGRIIKLEKLRQT
jgi:hypothetical protein